MDSQPLPSLRRYRPLQFDDLQRFGGRYDGGYVIPAVAVRTCRTVLSLGVEADWTFEQAVLDAVPGVKVICVDGTTGPDAIRARFKRDLWRAGSRLRPYKFAEAWSLRRKPEEFKTFFSRHTFLNLMVSSSNQTGHVSLAELMGRTDIDSPVLLKMDIEGSEYEVINGCTDLFDQCAVVLVEFHFLDVRWVDFQNSMATVMRTHYVAHIHGNNYDRYIPGTKVPKTIEVTFVHKRMCETEPRASIRIYPIEGLDSPNKRRRKEILLDLE